MKAEQSERRYPCYLGVTVASGSFRLMECFADFGTKSLPARAFLGMRAHSVSECKVMMFVLHPNITHTRPTTSYYS